MKTKYIKLFVFKSESIDGEPVKTTVFVTNGANNNPKPSIYIKRLMLTKHNDNGWELIKTFKDYYLSRNDFHVMLSSIDMIFKGIQEYQEEIEEFYKNTCNETNPCR